jgi:hypothetical protein
MASSKNDITHGGFVQWLGHPSAPTTAGLNFNHCATKLQWSLLAPAMAMVCTLKFQCHRDTAIA